MKFKKIIIKGYDKRFEIFKRYFETFFFLTIKPAPYDHILEENLTFFTKKELSEFCIKKQVFLSIPIPKTSRFFPDFTTLKVTRKTPSMDCLTFSFIFLFLYYTLFKIRSIESKLIMTSLPPKLKLKWHLYILLIPSEIYTYIFRNFLNSFIYFITFESLKTSHA